MGRLGRTFFVIAVSVLLLASIGSAARIVGTNGNDTLRGTPQADKLFGKKGNDKLYGMGGNDVLVPGQGRDKVYCGSGRDTVTADSADVVAKDCEIVKRPVTPPPPPPPPPAPPPPPPPPPAQAGHYKGLTSQNENFEFDVTGAGTGVTGLKTGQINQSCTPAADLSGGNLNFGTYTVPVASDGTFKIDVNFLGTVSGAPSSNRVVITGRFSGGLASGTLLETTSFAYSGVSYSCTSNPQTWSATRTS